MNTLNERTRNKQCMREVIRWAILAIAATVIASCSLIGCRTGNRIEIINSQGVVVNMYQSDSPQTLSKEVPIDLMRGGKVSAAGL